VIVLEASRRLPLRLGYRVVKRDNSSRTAVGEREM